jgi:hypothetical protein
MILAGGMSVRSGEFQLHIKVPVKPIQDHKADIQEFAKIELP